MKTHTNAILIILFGSIWGFFEATLGGFLHMFHWPLTGQIMSAIGIGIMFWALRCGVKPYQLLIVSAIAASFKFTDAFLFAIPVFDIKIINPAQAILMQGLAFGLITTFFRAFDKKLSGKMAATAGTLILSMVLFNLVSFFIIGYKGTAHLENVTMTFFLHWPAGIVLSTAAIYGVEALLKAGYNIFELGHLRPLLQTGLCAIFIILAVVFRGILV